VTTALSALALAGGMAVAVPAVASADVSADAPVIINELYGGGGNSGATYTNDYIELANTGDSAVDVSGWSVQYKSATGTNWGNKIDLVGSIAPGALYLVQAASGGANGVALPTPDASGTGINMSATNGNVALVSSQTVLTCATTACAADDAVVDLVGFGSGDAYAGTAAGPSGSNTESIGRDADSTNTADNAADFAVGTPTPKAVNQADSGGEDVGEKTIAELQGTTDVSPFAGNRASTKGVVTAAFPTGGYFGFTIQTPGSGGDIDFASHDASDGLWVYQSSGAVTVQIGDYVQVTGEVSEYKPSGSPYGLTELVLDSGADVVTLDETVEAVKPITNAWPTTDAQRESIESMVFAGAGTYTISNTYTTNQYGEVGLAYGATPLMQWTDVAAPGTPEADAVQEDNAARGVVLDDGASTNFLSSSNSDLTPPYISLDNPLRVGEQVTFNSDVIVDYRNSAWKLQPTSQVTPAEPGDYPVTWTDNRAAAPDAEALGDGNLRVASFNVLNYFTTLGDTRPDCSAYTDRDGNGITVRSCTGANGPRGAWDAASLQRQQDKIVHAINALDADVVGLMEIENSLVVEGPGHADEALATLVQALNDDAGSTKWAYVPSSADLPDAAEMDVITCAIIYQVDSVERLGDSHALGTESDAGEAFDDAREPIAQAFSPLDGGEPFLVVVNHFKSKGSAATDDPRDQDNGDGQGASNYTRTRQAEALNTWVTETLQPQTGVDDVFMTGDYNSYTMEDPLRILYDDGWTDLNSYYDTGKQSYSFSGMNGSLDHVLANSSALARTTGADIWNINAPESIALEYSRYNYHGTLFYDDSPFRSSDHDPVVVGFDSNAPITFSDVSETNPFAGDIYWLAGYGIVQGYPDGTFRPLGVVTRQTMAAFIYRIASEGGDKPVCDPQSDRMFTDVPADNPFCGEIEMLADWGIVHGYGDGTYHPVQPVSRQAMSAFLYRLWAGAESQDPTCDPAAPRAFSDVSAGNPFCGTIEWMAEMDITRGYGDGTYRPLGDMTRQAMAAMLHRFLTLQRPV
jgi:5'-nucleotidase